MKYDLHIHSKYSNDGGLEPEKIVEIAAKRGLRGIAITDHNTIKGGLMATQYETEDLKVIVATEIMTQKSEITGLFLSKIKEQGGIVVIPHPFDELRHSAFHPAKEDVRFVYAIECFNSRCVFQRYNKKAVEFAMEYDLTISAGSDAHFSNEIGNAGVITETGDVREAIMKRIESFFNCAIWDAVVWCRYGLIHIFALHGHIVVDYTHKPF